MDILQRANYMIFFDNVRMDHYIPSFQTNLGLYASDASATITMFRTDAMNDWKPYLVQVKIFGQNPFSGKFTLMFDGEITSRNWNDAKKDMGKIIFNVSGHYHWLEIPVPLAVSVDEGMNQLQRFIYQAQNINIEDVTSLIQSEADVLLKDKNIDEIIKTLFDQITKGYYDVGKENSAFGFAKVKDRFQVMVDVLEEFREAGFLDMFAFTHATQIDSFFAYLNQVLDQLMFEFYEDRDGSFRIKTPSWSDAILKSHILDASLVSSISGLDDWKGEPTRVLAIGSSSQMLGGAGLAGEIAGDPVLSATIPVGLYIGDPRKPEDEMYFSQSFTANAQQFGTGVAGAAVSGVSGSAGGLLEGARKWLGKLKYTLGKGNIESGNGDCSIFTRYCYKNYANLDIGVPTSNQIKQGTKIPQDQAQPGDLVFFHKTMDTRPPGQVSHVGIVSGNNNMVHLAGSGCREQSYVDMNYWGTKILEFRRVLSADSPALARWVVLVM